MKPKILLVFLMRFEEATRMLQGIVQHERSHRQWSTFLDDEARTERDPGFLRGEKWQGVISRHTTPALVKSCAQLGIPLVDLNDSAPFPGVPKIRPNTLPLAILARNISSSAASATSPIAVFPTKPGPANAGTASSRPCD